MKQIVKESYIEMAKETVSIINTGNYTTKEGTIYIRDEIKESIANTKLYQPDDFELLRKDIEAVIQKEKNLKKQTAISVVNETTTEAVKRLSNENVVCLNFASAKNPGGGFLRGTTTQEESIARASTLFASISKQHEYYDFNRAIKSFFYSDYIIYTPNVVFIRDEHGNLISDYYKGAVITSPAVNLYDVRLTEIVLTTTRNVMIQRIKKILEVAIMNGHKSLILGAFGCGVFNNNPKDVANYFNLLIGEGGIYENVFDKIVFAVPIFDWKSEKNYKAFKDVFDKI